MAHEYFLGFDYGEKNIGIAVGNSISRTAQPLMIINSNQGKPDWELIESLIKEWEIDAFVIGIPYTADGKETESIRKIRKFGNRLHGRFGLPLFEIDEGHTSQESEQYLRPSDRGKRGKLDALAAALILERYFNDYGDAIDHFFKN